MNRYLHYNVPGLFLVSFTISLKQIKQPISICVLDADFRTKMIFTYPWLTNFMTHDIAFTTYTYCRFEIMCILQLIKLKLKWKASKPFYYSIFATIDKHFNFLQSSKKWIVC